MTAADGLQKPFITRMAWATLAAGAHRYQDAEIAVAIAPGKQVSRAMDGLDICVELMV